MSKGARAEIVVVSYVILSKVDGSDLWVMIIVVHSLHRTASALSITITSHSSPSPTRQFCSSSCRADPFEGVGSEIRNLKLLAPDFRHHCCKDPEKLVRFAMQVPYFHILYSTIIPQQFQPELRFILPATSHRAWNKTQNLSSRAMPHARAPQQTSQIAGVDCPEF